MSVVDDLMETIRRRTAPPLSAEVARDILAELRESIDMEIEALSGDIARQRTDEGE